MVKVHALNIKQRGVGEKGEKVSILVTALTLGQLRGHVEVDRWTQDNENGYQRPPIDRRLKEIARYVLSEQGILPTSLLLATRPDDPIPLAFNPLNDTDGAVNVGLLDIPDDAMLWIVDGQNRFFGVERAYESGVSPELQDYPFPVSIIMNVNQYREMVHFSIINTTQRKMPTDIVDRHLVIRQQKEGLDMVASGPRGEKAYLQATATRIVDQLNETLGPWYHQIAIPGVPGRDKGLVRQHAMVASLDPVLKDNWVKSQNPLDEHVIKLLSNFWGALQDVWPDGFENPNDYRIQATVGLYTLHMLLPSVIQRCLPEGDLQQARIRDLIAGTGITSQFWSKEDGDPYTLGTGMASIRALAQYLISQLPPTGQVAIKL